MAQQRTAKGKRAGALTEVSVPSVTAELAGCHRAYRTASGCSVIVGHEPARAVPAGIKHAIVLPESALLLWHLSVAHRYRYPTWDEIADVRYALVPHEVTMAMLLPPPNEYVNAHDFCFHLWEIDDPRDPAIKGL